MKTGEKLKKTLKWITVLLFILTLLKIYYELRFFDLMLGIYEVERHQKKAALVSKKALMFITKKSEADSAIKERMSELGWTYVDTYGNGYIFSNEDEEILLRRHDYAIGYSTFEIQPGKEYRKTFSEETEAVEG
ncbi:hypothetical protein [Acidaminobacter hydrogenoformans]|uniref:Uncharacterized protein n=1 Tax=Acidaminobacter hydrogenoformans DSM 2784 TaxID=1120920 RepID=A0A1G5S6N1_9FIRM|nr:hypothetical protein [Acidaminobacter hydrogenoformans]SCZ82024.1 hypothetical protein SAMN03080599_03279 [Acidaminobacter hydrogenoformans DSM 2784]